MKNIIKMMAAFCVVAMVCGCKKSFLELAPVSNANAANFYKTTADFDLAINAAYNSLYTIYAPEGAVSYCGEQMGDNAIVYNISGIEADKWQFKDYTFNTSNTVVYTFWQNFYQSLYNINIVLDKIEGAGVPAAYKSQAKAEMKFLRGLYYFNMVQIWGDIPLVTAPVAAAASYSVLRSPQAAIYSQVISDLKFAVDTLPLVSAITVKGKASRGAAQMLLGQVYLTMGDKTNATQMLTAVYNSKQYSLVSTYAGLWGPAVKNSTESIFEIQYLGGSTTNPYSKYYQSFFPNASVLSFFGSGMNQVTDDLYNEYETNDPRQAVSISLGYQNGATFVQQKYTKKWTDAAATITNGNSLANNNFMVLRYADLLLLLSEATGDAQYLNLVRTRVGLPLYGSAGYPSAKYATLDLAIEHERRVELAIEFHRWFDLKRTGRATTVLTAKKGKAITANMLLLPIPKTVILQNPAIVQNTGY